MLKKSLLLLTLAVCMAGFNGNSEAAAAKALTAKQASIVTVAAFTAQGDLPNLKTALNEALDNGMTVNEVKEVLVQNVCLLRFSAQFERHQYFDRCFR